MGDYETFETRPSLLPSEMIGRIRRDHESRLRQYEQLLLSYNRKVNLVSRKTESSVFERHILHCLSVCIRDFLPGVTIADWGSGGGLPAVPVAIANKDVTVVAIDAVFKKTQAVKAMAKRLELNNLETWNGRADRWEGSCTYSVSRATAPLAELWKWHIRVFDGPSAIKSLSVWNPGLICLKGGDLSREIDALIAFEPDARVETYDLAPIFGGAYFRGKRIVHVYVGD